MRVDIWQLSEQPMAGWYGSPTNILRPAFAIRVESQLSTLVNCFNAFSPNRDLRTPAARLLRGSPQRPHFRSRNIFPSTNQSPPHSLLRCLSFCEPPPRPPPILIILPSCA